MITIPQFVLSMILTVVATTVGLLAFGLWVGRRADAAAAAGSSDNVHVVSRGERVILVIDVENGHQETVAMSTDRAFALVRSLSAAANAVWRRKGVAMRMGVAKFDMHKQRRRARERSAQVQETADA